MHYDQIVFGGEPEAAVAQVRRFSPVWLRLMHQILERQGEGFRVKRLG